MNHMHDSILDNNVIVCTHNGSLYLFLHKFMEHNMLFNLNTSAALLFCHHEIRYWLDDEFDPKIVCNCKNT